MLRTPKAWEIRNKRVLLRIDINVENFSKSNLRLRSIKPTIDFLLHNKAKQIILISHWGRPKGPESKYSLKNSVPVLEKVLGCRITFCNSLDHLPSEKIILLENIRFWEGEEKNDPQFAKKLASLGDIYINEAFSVSHRQNASVSRITQFLPSYCGFRFYEEINQLEKFKKSSKKPILIILGGAKIADKLPLINKFIKQADHIIIGGALANTLLYFLGFETGKSLVDKATLSQLKNFNFSKIILPFDFFVLDKSQKKQHRFVFEIKKTDNILDIGDYSMEYFGNLIKKSKTIFWNGPMGYIEAKKFQRGTKKLVNYLDKSQAQILIGGGETLNFTKPLEQKKNIFISTGGGALLEYLVSGKRKCEFSNQRNIKNKG